MDKTIVTSFMIIAALICAVLTFKGLYPAVVRGSDAVATMGRRMDVRFKSEIEIIHAAGELDSDGAWQDLNGDGDFDAFLWVKNVGSLRISAVESCDLFFGPEGNFSRIPHESRAGGAFPYWSYEIENDATAWDPTSTAEVTVHFPAALSSQRYFVKVVTPDGVADEYYYSM